MGNKSITQAKPAPYNIDNPKKKFKSITQAKPAKLNMHNLNKKFKNLNYRCSCQFALNNLLLRCESYNPDNDRNAILEVINSSNGKIIGKSLLLFIT